MGRKSNDVGGGGGAARSWILVAASLVSCLVAYTTLTLRRPGAEARVALSVGSGGAAEECCRGIENMELWGPTVKWGTDHKFSSSTDCCRACKAMCNAGDGPCLCNSWVFCGDRERCGDKFGQCWLKKQKDVMLPEVQDSGKEVIWTSGLIFEKGEGIVGLETDHGTLHMKLLPECAPHSVVYVSELLKSRHCAGCHIYRAEGRGHSWDSEGNAIADVSLGPPYALVQGKLEAEGTPFKDIPVEARSEIKRGSVAWVGSGPEFFISLANHGEWRRSYTVFGDVLPEDMEIAEKIATLPTRSDVWNNINVSVLVKRVPFKVRSAKGGHGNLNLGTNDDFSSGQS